MAGGTTGPEQRQRRPAFYCSLTIPFNRDMNILMGQLWKQCLLKLSVKCKAQIPKKPVAAFTLRLSKGKHEQQTPCDTRWQRDSPGDHFTLSLSGKAAAELQIICHDCGV